MTFTAMRPDSGLWKGREVSLCRVDQASSLISAFSISVPSPVWRLLNVIWTSLHRGNRLRQQTLL